MPQTYPKRLIEVDLPIARISAHARREKSIRHGHISTLHIWWARRPLAACRAVICASLWPDPGDPLCPPVFRQAAVEQVGSFAARVFPAKITPESRQLQETASPESLGRWQALAEGSLTLDAHQPADWGILRLCLLDFIADFANWDNSTLPAYLETSRALTQAAHEALGGVAGTRPLVVDPFAGGGSIPLEALRVGADAFASDLNPVAVLLNKVVLEYVPKYGDRLADEVRKWGQWVKEEAEKELAEFYPKDEDGSTPIAYLWARTIECEGPGCGLTIPLVGSFWLCRKREPKFALKLKMDDEIAFDVLKDPKASDVASGLTSGNKATCPKCGYTTPTNRVKAQLIRRHGGSDDSKLLAVVTTDANGNGKYYRAVNDSDVEAAERVKSSLSVLETRRSNSLPAIPHESCPPVGALGFRFQPYGIDKWRFLYTPRQLAALVTFSHLVSELPERVPAFAKLEPGFRDTVQLLLALAIGRMNDRCCTLCRWEPDYLKIQAANGAENKMPMRLDFVESNPFGGKSGDWNANVTWIARVVEHVASMDVIGEGTASRSPAQASPLPDDTAMAFVTDPPYYDAFGYSDLSEFFYVWLRRAVPKNMFLDFSSDKPDKAHEAIAIGKTLDDGRGKKDRESYLEDMKASFVRAREVTMPNGIGLVVFASKSTAAWQAILDALINAGWVVTGSWPIDTEMAHRTRALGAAALHSSIHLLCRPRENETGTLREEVGEWRDVLAELPQRIHEWMPRLAAEGVVGADAIFACLGPALEIFSRYSRVEKASGEAVPLREYLEQVWAAVSTEALSMIFRDADAAGLEPDARLTAMWLWTLGAGTGKAGGNGKAIPIVPGLATDDEDETPLPGKPVESSGYTLEYDAARKIAQGLGIHLEQSDTIVEVKGDKARLLPVSERTRHLFGKAEGGIPNAGKKKKTPVKQKSLFDQIEQLEAEAETEPGELKPTAGETVLDRVHQAMILFAAGRGEALRRFLVDDGAGKDARFWKLAQSLSALYPKETDEKRWVDGVLARKKGLGL